jgi:hypothetical protein
MNLFMAMQKLYDEHPETKFDVNHYNKSREDQVIQFLLYDSFFKRQR